MRPSLTLATLLTILSVAELKAQTLTFESLSSSGDQTGLTSYTESGFTLSPGTAGNERFGKWGTASENYTGSTGLYQQNPGSTITLSQVGGGTFSLTSIDISELIKSDTIQTVPLNFTGTKAAGGTVTAHFDLDGTFGNQTLVFNDFSGLTSVSWTQEAGYHQFDNIVIIPVPEPASVFGFAAVCGGALGLIRRYRRRHSSSLAGSSSDSAGDFITSRSNTVA